MGQIHVAKFAECDMFGPCDIIGLILREPEQEDQADALAICHNRPVATACAATRPPIGSLMPGSSITNRQITSQGPGTPTRHVVD